MNPNNNFDQIISQIERDEQQPSSIQRARDDNLLVEWSRRVDYSGVPQADLRAGRGEYPRGFPLLLSDAAGRQVHGQAHGAGLYLRKGYAQK